MSDPAERRRHTRFDMRQTGSTLRMEDSVPSAASREPCRLLNLSHGGMCFSFPRPLAQKAVHRFRMELPEFGTDPIELKAEIRWVEQRDGSVWVMGAAFVESSAGWFASPGDPAEDG